MSVSIERAVEDKVQHSCRGARFSGKMAEIEDRTRHDFQPEARHRQNFSENRLGYRKKRRWRNTEHRNPILLAE